MTEAKPAAVPLALKRTLIIMSGLLAIAAATLAHTPIVKAAFATKALPPHAMRSASAPPSADRPFVEQALAAADQAATLHGLIAARAEHPALRGYAQQVPPAGAPLAARLRQAHAELAAAASQRPIPGQAELDRAATLRGAAFDRAVMDMEVQQRQRLLDLAEQHARSGNNAELRAVAADSVPSMRRQLDRAHQAAAELARASTPTPRPVARAPTTIGGPIPEPRPATDLPNATTDLNLRELQRIGREAGRPLQ
jgi:putative membrane protein